DDMDLHVSHSSSRRIIFNHVGKTLAPQGPILIPNNLQAPSLRLAGVRVRIRRIWPWSITIPPGLASRLSSANPTGSLYPRCSAIRRISDGSIKPGMNLQLILQALQSHTVRSKPSSVLGSDMAASPPDNVDRIPLCADGKVSLSLLRAAEAASSFHPRPRRYPAPPELSEGRLIPSHLFPPVSRRAAAACGPAFRVRRFQRASCPISGRAGPRTLAPRT